MNSSDFRSLVSPMMTEPAVRRRAKGGPARGKRAEKPTATVIIAPIMPHPAVAAAHHVVGALAALSLINHLRHQAILHSMARAHHG